ncbi:pentatricopeptide repeat-containing protein At5g28460-like [Nymphaea colorata]|uniref:Pentacotripeptide-repeat region of PRORP domain-containing protein n=1 Tax=Nymphaea colorata TaxID=210225 RepID=A0A5K1DT49_9MAGN|nr:pentatricopeptide repeat-containing protein At5g28460-like [Nymphaea colorata]
MRNPSLGLLPSSSLLLRRNGSFSHRSLSVDTSPVELAADLLRSNEWSPEVEKELSGRLPSFSPSQLLLLIERIGDSRKALKFFEWAKSRVPTCPISRVHAPSAFFSMFKLALGDPVDSRSRMEELIGKFDEHRSPLTLDSASLLIKYFGRAKSVEKSIAVFEEVKKSRIPIRRPFLYNNLLDVLVKFDRFDRALELIHEMLCDCAPNYVTFSIVFSGLLKKSRPLDALRLAEKMASHGVFPDAIHLTQLISKLCNIGERRKAWIALHAVMDKGGKVHVPSFNALLAGLGRDCDFSKMNLLLSEMKKLGVEPNIVTFSTLINNLCKSHRVDEALHVFENMTEAGGCVPDVIMFNTLVDGLCKVGRRQEGLALVGRMKEFGCSPNVVTYNCLIDGFCKAGEIDGARELFTQMVNDEVRPNMITMNCILDGMCKNGRIGNALEFFRSIEEKGLKGNAVTYGCMINGFCQVNNVGKALALFEEMKQRGVAPDFVIYCTLISGLSYAERLDEARSYLNLMKNDGFCPDNVCYNILINGFCNNKEFDKAYEMLVEMEKVGLKPDTVTYNTLITAACRDGDFSSAHELIEKMIADGSVASVVTYGSLIHGYSKSGNLDQAINLFNSMPKVGLSPNIVIYNILIDFLSFEGRADDALSLMNDMRDKGIIPNVITYNAMLRGLARKNLRGEAFQLMDQMKEQGCDPDNLTAEVLTNWFSTSEDLSKIRSFLEETNINVHAVSAC